MKTKEKLSVRIAVKISTDIQKGFFPSGSKLPTEPELMKRYTVGRSTIREAIQFLSISKIVRVQQGSGTYVLETTELSTQDHLKKLRFEEINDVRKTLESELIIRACQTATKEQLQAIEESLLKKKQAILEENKEACIRADISFHLNIAIAANHNAFFILYQDFSKRISSFFDEREPKGISTFAMNYHLHEELFNAIRLKKEKKSIQILHQILQTNFRL